MQAREFNNDECISFETYIDWLLNSYSIYFALYSALYFFGDYIARTATAQKGVRNSADISVICSLPIS